MAIDSALALTALACLPHSALALGNAPYISFSPSSNAFSLVNQSIAAPIYVDKADWVGVSIAVNSLAHDIHSVSGQTPVVGNEIEPDTTPVIVGTIGRSAEIDRLVEERKIDVSSIKGKWESFIIQVVQNPAPGVKQALVIAGSDKRGSIYGVYDLSEGIGVSPWYWWDDVAPRRHSAIFVLPKPFVQGPPAIKYRGIFINDENPSLADWVTKNFGGFNGKFYPHVFELLLRLKANYLWPAMWGKSFNVDDPQNPVLADEYGIVMGTSHQEPMMRADAEIYGGVHGAYDYSKNRDNIYKFWQGGVDRVKNFENIYTVGMRGTADTKINAPTEQIISLLQQIVADQRTILSNVVNPDLSKVPQMWCLYKEVSDYYDEGLRVPGDVTLLWSDDNNGNLRRLPTPSERSRVGGAGIYYHVDYVGGPRDYKWVCTVPVEKIWHQLNLAYHYDARQVWIVNVGSLKQKEFDIQFFMNYAWNPESWPRERVSSYARLWAAQQFDPKYAQQIGDIMTGYLKLNGMRKPEQMSAQPYSVTNYNEAERISKKWKDLTEQAEAIYTKLPADEKDSFYQLVVYPTKASGNVAEIYFAASKNKLYAKQGRASAIDEADRVDTLFKLDADLSDYYNKTMGNGKWGPFMSQVHIGYSTWSDPDFNIKPSTTKPTLSAEASMAVAVDNSGDAWPGASKEAVLPTFDNLNNQSYSIDVFNRGQEPFSYSATPSAPWIVVTPSNGKVEKDQRLSVSIDWAKAPAGSTQGTVLVASPGMISVIVAVDIDNEPVPATRHGVFLEKQGYVSIEAEHFSSNKPGKTARWEAIANYGRTLSTMLPFPIDAESVENTKDAPCLTYDMYLSSQGAVSVNAIVAPANDYVPGRGIKYAVAFDNQKPVICDMLGSKKTRDFEWNSSVIDNCKIIKCPLTVDQPGFHTLKIWMVDPGLALQKIVVDFGGVKPSYLGPPESYRISVK